MSGYIGLVLQEPGFADPRLDAHASQTILDLVAPAALYGRERNV